MTILSASQQEILRSRPQQSTLYLSIFEPQEIFRAQINDGNITKGARVITFDNVSLGVWTVIEPNMTLLIGTTAGARDIGKIRVKSTTSSTITVSENSNIEWGDNLFLTVLKYVELWPVYPRIIANPNDEADSIFYKDYDIAYTNQNSILGTFPCAGPHRGLFKGEQAWYSSTGTLNLKGDSLNYNWTFEGGSPSSSSSANPGFVTYNTPGHYVTKLQISGSSGSVDTTYRYVSVYDREGEGSSPPIIKWEMTNFGGSRDEGGYKVSFRVREDVEISENAVVVLFADDWYGNTRVSLGGNYPNAPKIFFVGYILEDSINYNYADSYVDFSAASISELMKQSSGFSVSVESVANPDKWYELLDMDCRRAIYHYLRWHTTALQIADFEFKGDDRKIQFFDADRGSMFDAIDNLMRNTLIGKSVSDRQGKMWMEVEAKAYPTPTSSFPSTLTISKRDWMGQPSIEEKLSDQLSYLEYGGIAYSGVVTGTFSALLGSAPGNAPSFRGRTETLEGLALVGQAQLNQLVANVWANENADYPVINMDMGINARNLDIAPQETSRIQIAASDTVRNEEIDGLYLPHGMDWQYDPIRQLLVPRVTWRVLVDGDDGESIIVPIDASGIEGGFSVPQLQIPPLPVLTVPPSLTELITSIVNSIVAGGSYALVGWDGTGLGFNNLRSGFNVTQSTKSTTSSIIQLQLTSNPGIYCAIAVFSQLTTGSPAGTPGTRITGQLGVSVAGDSQVQIRTQGFVANNGQATQDGEVSGLFSASINTVIRADLSSGIETGAGTLASPDTFSLAVFKVG